MISSIPARTEQIRNGAAGPAPPFQPGLRKSSPRSSTCMTDDYDVQTAGPATMPSLRDPAHQRRCAKIHRTMAIRRNPAPLPGQLLQAGERCRLFHRRTASARSTADFTLTPPSPVSPIPVTSRTRTRTGTMKNAYVYANIPYRETLTMTAGASYDDFSLNQDIESTRPSSVCRFPGNKPLDMPTSVSTNSIRNWASPGRRWKTPRCAPRHFRPSPAA